ncbi:MAG TPA: hypothetical protein VJ927_04970 [Actinomycetota bacterium]|nr:hypothetical protein [Actinomycetota bacterium]
MTDERRDDDGLQHPLVHEGADPDPEDSNEAADEKATILQPSGEPVTDAQED